MPLLIELSPREGALEFNRKRWAEVVADVALTKMPGKIETNRHGQILMMPPASGAHSCYQGEIGFMLRNFLGGKTLPECPISTADGVRAADIGWYSAERFRKVEGQLVFEWAPEICVEVVSPSNTAKEMEEKRALYFEAGAKEVWLCQTDGKMEFYLAESPWTTVERSLLCPKFPAQVP